MFCQKCGSQNANETRFCRKCGVELSQIPAAVQQQSLVLAERSIELNSLGLKGLLLGVGFLIISGIIFSIPPRDGILWLLPLAFAFSFLSSSISRFVQARGIKKLSRGQDQAALPAAATEYIDPVRSIYETDELSGVPASVTERTTRHLKLNSDGEAALETKVRSPQDLA